jgi:hypothetical protein
MSAPTMSASGPGLSATIPSSLPTPRTSDAAHGPEMCKVRGEKRTGMNLPTMMHPAALDRLPTPMATDGMKDGAGGGAGSTYPLRMILATPRKSDADKGGRGDVLSQLQGHASRHAGMMPTPVKPNGGRRLNRQEIETGRRANGAKAQIDTPNLLRHAETMLPTPVACDYGSNRSGSGLRTPSTRHMIRTATTETLPTPTKRDSRMDGWSPAYDRRKSPTMDAVMDGAMTDRAPDKWAGARALAAMLRSRGLTGTAALPITYGWMMGFPPGWLARALRSAVHAGRLRPA